MSPEESGIMAYYTGLRSSDMLTIKAEDRNLERKILSYYSPKSKLYGDIPFHSDLLSVLK